MNAAIIQRKTREERFRQRKNDSYTQQCQNYGGITVFSNAAKIFARITDKQLGPTTKAGRHAATRRWVEHCSMQFSYSN